MNHAFLSRWSAVLQTWVAVPETARRRQCGGRRRAPRAVALTLALAVAPAMAGITLSGDVSPPGPPTLPDWNIPGTDLFIGENSAGSMIVDNASTVSNGLLSFIGYNPGSNGAVTVSGAGSLWSTPNSLFAGVSGIGFLTIENGGTVSTGTGIIGSQFGGTGTVTVTGTGSTWTNSDMLIVGSSGNGTLYITAGGVVTALSGSIGDQASGTGAVKIDGAGSLWRLDGLLIVGGINGSGTMSIENGGQARSSDGWIGVTRNGAVTVTGANSAWINTGALFVGLRGTGTLNIEAGGAVSNAQADIGSDPGSTGAVTVNGAGSTWTNLGTLTVGSSGNGTLNIEAGGKVMDPTGTIGLNLGGTGIATVSGPGSVWTNSMILYVGQGGNGSLTVNNGGAVNSTTAYIGLDAHGTAIVTGAGSTWINASKFSIGVRGTGLLDIEAGGKVSSTASYIGQDVGGVGAVTVTGAGSTWSNSDILIVGERGKGTLNIEAGGKASNTAAHIGQDGNGAVTVSGANSTWTNAGMLFVGVLGTGDLKIQAGGTVNSTSSVIGASNISTGSATVTGTGSTWTHSGTLFVGESGKGTLDITAGGMVTALSGAIGYKNSGTGAARIDGAGSLWRLDGLLSVGGHDGSGTMIIENGGQVSSGDGSIGVTRNGAATVTGAGSVWINSNALIVGESGTGTLTLADHGRLNVGGGAGTLYLGYNSFAPNSGTGTLNIGAAPGNPAVAPGTVEAGKIQFGNGSNGAATLNFNHTAPASAPYDFNVALAATGTGSRDLNQLAGATRLTADSPSFNGAVTVNGGTLIVAPGVTLGTSSTVVSNGRLQVDGTLGNTTSPTGSPVVVVMSSTLAGAGSIVGNVDLPTLVPAPLPGTPLGILEGRQGQTLTITGNLSFAYDSHINAILGSATAPSATTGLFNVGGDLVLDGILNVSTAGAFGPGIYRLINYAGALTDNGLDIGAHPAGFNLSVQTAVANQVNLGVTSTAPLPPDPDPGPGPGPGPTPTLVAWDGSNPSLYNNNNVDGGLGTWHVGGGNWTDLDGTLNSPYPTTATFVLFQARPGTVTINNSAGLVRVTGLQFATSGYRLQGDPLTLEGGTSQTPQTLIRVGDGTPASAATTATIAAPLVGNSNLTKTDYGTLILAGSNTYTGGTEIRSGTLSISADANLGAASGAIGLSGGTLATTASLASARPLSVTQNSRLDITAGTTLELSGSIGGASQFDKTGTGTLLLTGNGAGFGGGATVSAGTLRIGGSGRLGGSVSVASGATLSGNGLIGSGSGAGSTVTLASGATLAPGNSIGTLSIDGDLTFEAGSRYAVEVDPHGSAADLTRITGHATLNGGTVAHIGNDGTYPLRASYTILSAQGGLSGRFDAVSSVYTFLTPSLSYDDTAGTVALTLDRNDTPIATPALTRNQAATALGVDSLGWNAANPVYDAIVTLTGGSPALAASLDALSGEIHASARAALVDDSRHVRDAMNERLRSAFNTVGAARAPVIILGSGEPATAPAATPGLAFWTQGFGSWGQTAGDGNAARLTRSNSGLFLGVDGPIGDNARLGALAGYSRTDFDVDARASSGDSENIHAGLYGGAQWNQLALRTGLAYTWHDIDTHRSVALPAFKDNLKGHYDGATAQAFADLGYRIDTPALALEPFARLDNVNLTTDGFNEHGGAAALESKRERTATTFSTLGLRGETALTLANGTTLTPRATLGWRHAWGDIEPHSTFAFSGGTAFSIAGVPIARDAALLEAGVEIAATPTVAVSLAYTGQIAQDAQDHALQARIQWRF